MGDPEINDDAENREEDSGFEIADLEILDAGEHRRSALFARAFLRWQGSLCRRHLHLAFTICITVLVVSIVVYNLGGYLASRQRGQTGQQSPTSSSFSYAPLNTSFTQEDGMVCVTDNAWSPDSQQVAVLGNEDGCSGVNQEPGLLNIYSAHTRQVVKQLPLDALILQSIGEHRLSRGRSGLAVAYMHVLWSPDGRRLAVSFVDTDQPPLFTGIVLVDATGKQAQVLLQPYHQASVFYEWDVVRGMPVSEPAPSPALVYRWGRGGRLISQTPLPAPFAQGAPPAAPPGPVGNPDGGASFTLWQPGLANAIPLKNGLVVYSFSTDFAAWSPDARYFVEGIDLEGLMKPTGKANPGRQMLEDYRVDVAPFLVAHDAALLKVVSDLTVVAWSPDGRVLATYVPGKAIMLYEAASGRKLAALSPSPHQLSLQGIMGVLRWSPDGSSLLLTGARWGTVTLWQVKYEIPKRGSGN